jgi:hypothetical protein
LTAITPVPFGLPLVVLGLVILATVSPATLRWVRRRWGWLNKRFLWLQDRAPAFLRKKLERTDPDAEKKKSENEKEDDTPPNDKAATARRLLERA